MGKYCTYSVYFIFVSLFGYTTAVPKCNDTCPAEPNLCKIKQSNGEMLNCSSGIAPNEMDKLVSDKNEVNTVNYIRGVRNKASVKMEKGMERRRRSVSSGEDEEWGLDYKTEELKKTTWHFLRKPTRTNILAVERDKGSEA